MTLPPPVTEPPETPLATRPWLRRAMRRFGVSLILMLAILSWGLSDRKLEHIGDNMQIAVPLTGLACAVATGEGVRYLGRFTLLVATYTLSKRGLGATAINERPNGGYGGFPSGHTAASTFGATWLVSSCLAENRMAQGLTLLSAGFVGGTRIQVGAHSVWQVLSGAFVGWMAQFLALTWFDRLFRRFWSGTGSLIGRAGRNTQRLARRGWDRLEIGRRFSDLRARIAQRNR
ncbi:MAG: phosphatase PAP2 family protein [Pseudodonghicola sp.]